MAVKTEKKESTAQNVAQTRTTYKKSDIIENATVFDTTPEILTGALTLIDKNEVTKTEVCEALDKFLKMTVTGRKEQ